MIIALLVGCFYGIRKLVLAARRAWAAPPTRAVVVSSVWIFVVTFFIGRIFVNLG